MLEKTTPHKTHFFSIIFFLLFILALLMVACDSDSASSNEQSSSEEPSNKDQTSSEEDENFVDGILTDSRDGQKYKTVVIDSQVWMAENLNFETEDSYCYDNDPNNCSKYGRLYIWKIAQYVCPAGWHIPNDDEWKNLFESVGGFYIAGKVLKSKSDWDTEVKGTDEFGFAAKPSGVAGGLEKGRIVHDIFYDKGNLALFWSASGEGRIFWIGDYEYVFWGEYWDYLGLSVRCLYNKPADRPKPNLNEPAKRAKDSITDSRDGKEYRVVTIGSQTWMAENLNYKMKESYCYNDSTKYCDEYGYGRYYSWDAAIKACPEGWHLPIIEEWEELINAVGGASKAAQKLKTILGWAYEDENGERHNIGGQDTYKFSIMPAGRIGANSDYVISFEESLGEGEEAVFWAADATPFTGSSMAHVIVNEKMTINELGWDSPSAISVRCLQN